MPSKGLIFTALHSNDYSLYGFFCLGFIVPLENFSLIWRRHYYRWRAAKLDLCSALMAIEQWEFFSVPHLLWHLWWSSGRIRDTHTYCRVYSSGAVTTCFYVLGLSRLGFEHPTFRLRGQYSNPVRHRRGRLIWMKYFRMVFRNVINFNEKLQKMLTSHAVRQIVWLALKIYAFFHEIQVSYESRIPFILFSLKFLVAFTSSPISALYQGVSLQ